MAAVCNGPTPRPFLFPELTLCFNNMIVEDGVASMYVGTLSMSQCSLRTSDMQSAVAVKLWSDQEQARSWLVNAEPRPKPSPLSLDVLTLISSTLPIDLLGS